MSSEARLLEEGRGGSDHVEGVDLGLQGGAAATLDVLGAGGEGTQRVYLSLGGC
jgi:hypothetical protein